MSLSYISQVLYVLCFTRPRYQVSVYTTIDPLVEKNLSTLSDGLNFFDQFNYLLYAIFMYLS